MNADDKKSIISPMDCLPDLDNPAPAAPPIQSERNLLAAVLAFVIFAGLSIWGAFASQGFLEADSCTHYLMARFAIPEFHYFVDIWGRPFVTGLYAFPAHYFGRTGVRLTSLLTALAISIFAYRIARNQKYRWPVLALIFTLAGPLFFLHSFSALTELPFALLLVIGFWAYQRQSWLIMTLAIGLTPLARPEGFGFLILAALALILHRQFVWLILLPVPLAAWNYSGWVLFGKGGPWWRWLKDYWPYSADSLYQSGPLTHFLVRLPVIISPLIFPAMWLGVWRSLRRGEWGRRLFGPDHTARCQFLIAAIPLMILIGHSLLYWLGKMASSGEMRYMLIVMPFWGLLGAKGWEWVFVYFGKMKWAVPAAALAALAPILTHFYYPVLPLTLSADWRQGQRMAQWYQQTPLHAAYPYLLTAHPAVLYFMDTNPTGPFMRDWSRKVIDHPPHGTLVIWDPIYGVFNSDASRSIHLKDLLAAGWVMDTDETTTEATGSPDPLQAYFRLKSHNPAEWFIFLSPQTISGKPTPAAGEILNLGEQSGTIRWKRYSPAPSTRPTHGQ